jgi:hypothetical protein
MFPFVRAPLAPPNQERNDILSIISPKEHILASAKKNKRMEKQAFSFSHYSSIFIFLKKN